MRSLIFLLTLAACGGTVESSPPPIPVDDAAPPDVAPADDASSCLGDCTLAIPLAAQCDRIPGGKHPMYACATAPTWRVSRDLISPFLASASGPIWKRLACHWSLTATNARTPTTTENPTLSIAKNVTIPTQLLFDAWILFVVFVLGGGGLMLLTDMVVSACMDRRQRQKRR